jgi:hypothetical protein
MSRVFRSHENEVKLINPNEFFKKMSTPTESRLASWVRDVKENSHEQLDTDGVSKLVEIDPATMKWRWRVIKNTSELKECIAKSEKAHGIFLKMREASYARMLSGKEDNFGGYGFSDESSDGYSGGQQVGSFPTRSEYTPLIGSPFFKALYLTDYWEMHSKAFWYSNYSGIAKMIIDMTRNFVMGRGFSVSFKDKKAQDVWNKYEEYSNIQEESRNWCDDLTKFGENMLKKIPSPKGIIHKAFDPSTIWEIVTDPEDISESGIKYYHQQYNTQYQIFGDKNTPLSKYIINQLPPQLVFHTKVNITPYEKRGRSDLLAPMLYFRYFEDYMQAKLIRAKNEAAFIWDVSIDGSDEDVQAYINGTQSMADVPPGSENVHNKAVERVPLSPTFGTTGADQVAQDILSYVAMATSIPLNYFGTSFTSSSGTKAGALVATEPVAKKMIERQLKMEFLIRRIVKDVLKFNNMDPSIEFEVNFPEIMEEDRSQKIQDLVLAKDEKAISHRTFAEITAKELKINRYSYDDEQDQIEEEMRDNPNLSQPMPDQDLTKSSGGTDDGNGRSIGRSDTKQSGMKF